MKLQSQKSSEYKDKEYVKFWVVIPNKIIQELGWRSGDELEAKIKKEELIIKKGDKNGNHT